jgi:hypothetical protein
MKYIAIGLMIVSAAFPAAEETVTWDWLAPRFTACEDVVVHGAFRIYVSASVSDLGQSRKRIRSLSVYAESAALQQNKGELSGNISIKKNGVSIASASFVRQPPNTIAETPKSTETARLFLPAGKELEVPQGSTVVTEVSLALRTDSGSCSLGSTSNSRDRFK